MFIFQAWDKDEGCTFIIRNGNDNKLMIVENNKLTWNWWPFAMTDSYIVHNLTWCNFWLLMTVSSDLSLSFPHFLTSGLSPHTVDDQWYWWENANSKC